jgi:hypothetical protein
VEASPVRIPADGTTAVLRLRFAMKFGPFNAPLLVRARAVDKGKPVVAEVKLETFAD